MMATNKLSPVMASHVASHITSPSTDGLLSRAKSMLNRLRWLSPTDALSSSASSRFGRNIEKELLHLVEHQGVMMLKLRTRDTAVVMSVEHYDEMLKMKETWAQLLEAEADAVIAKATDDYESLYSRITSPESHQAADALFSANSKDLGKTYQPGQTESE